ncbi:hypothetical protein MRS44_010360 [Fusarium solani]|uniref:uncharacterized protein n=1 Tax=Fusarium solani TaxID=169388 RepID=UPI0032C3E8E5|nr:hypothetical protein MRS44_010360 [Fusarium solani]
MQGQNRGKSEATVGAGADLLARDARTSIVRCLGQQLHSTASLRPNIRLKSFTEQPPTGTARRIGCHRRRVVEDEAKDVNWRYVRKTDPRRAQLGQGLDLAPPDVMPPGDGAGGREICWLQPLILWTYEHGLNVHA